MNAKQRKRSAVPVTDPRSGPGRGKRKIAHTSKAIVVGMLERGGNVVAKVVATRKRKSLVPEIVKHVEPGSGVYTDDLHSYRIFDESYSPADYEHKVIDHCVAYVETRPPRRIMMGILKLSDTAVLPFTCPKVTRQSKLSDG